MTTNAVSFICEHTAEFALIPDMKRILNKFHRYVTPIFPWLTREGSGISKSIHNKDKFLAVAVFPRRPKISSEHPLTIQIKINHELLEVSERGLAYGIPFIAGCPLATNLWALGDKPYIFWTTLNNSCQQSYSATEIDGEWFFADDNQKNILKSDDQVYSYVSKKARLLTFAEFLLFIRQSRNEMPSRYNLHFGGGGYKPVYFLIKRNDINSLP